VPADSSVWIDTADSYSSLFFYLDRKVRAWRPGKASPTLGDYVVLVNQSAVTVDYRRDVRIEPVAEALGKDRRTYRLGRLVPMLLEDG